MYRVQVLEQLSGQSPVFSKGELSKSEIRNLEIISLLITKYVEDPEAGWGGCEG